MTDEIRNIIIHVYVLMVETKPTVLIFVANNKGVRIV